MKSGKNRPEKISDIIPHIKQSEILRLGVELLPVWKQWKQLVGEEFADLAEPSGFRRGTLHIKVKNNSVMHRLTFEKDQILKRIKGILQKDLIEDLFFELDDNE